MDMKHIDLIRNYYGPRFQSASGTGGDHEIVGWESGEAQKKRFEVFCRNVSLAGKKLLDVGCGVGSLLAYIMAGREENREALPDYTGIDILDGMVEEARKRFPDGKFLTGDVFTKNIFAPGSFDIVFSSGLFNLNYGDNYGFFREAFRRLCEISRETVAVNLLHTRSGNKEDSYFYYHPDQVRAIAEGLCPNGGKITVLEEYLPNDFTLIATR